MGLGKKTAEAGALVSSRQVRGTRCPSDVPGDGQVLRFGRGLPAARFLSHVRSWERCRVQPVLSSVSHAWFCEPLQVLVSPRRPVPNPGLLSMWENSGEGFPPSRP